MDPMRQSVDLSRLVIAKEFFASPAKAPTNRGGPRIKNPNTRTHVADISDESPERHLSSSQAVESPVQSGWPLRLDGLAHTLIPESPSLADKLSPESASSSLTPPESPSPTDGSPGLEAFLQESPALFSEPRAMNGRGLGLSTLGTQQGKREGVNRALAFGAPADVMRNDKVACGQLAESDRRAEWAEQSAPSAGRAQSPLTPRVEVQTRQAHNQDAGVKLTSHPELLKPALLPSPPKRTPPQLRRSQSQRPLAPRVAGCETVGVNAGPRNLRTPVGWVGFDEAGTENDENRDLSWASGVRNTHASEIRTHVRTGDMGTQGSKSPGVNFQGARSELAKRSPMKSKSVLKSPLRENEARGTGNRVRWSENGVSARSVSATREPFQQMSENAATNGMSEAGVNEKKRQQQGVLTKLRSPVKPTNLRRPSPLGKGCLPSPTQPLSAAFPPSSAPFILKPVGAASCQKLHVAEKAERTIRPTSPLEKEEASVEVHVAQEPIIVGRVVISGGMNGLEKPGPRFEDTEFRMGLANLAKLKLKPEQGPGEDAGAPGGFCRSVSGSFVGEVPASRTAVETELAFDELDKGGRASVEESGQVDKAAGKTKWGFGRFGRKTTGGREAGAKEEGGKPEKRPGAEGGKLATDEHLVTAEGETHPTVAIEAKNAQRKMAGKGGAREKKKKNVGILSEKKLKAEKKRMAETSVASAAGEGLAQPCSERNLSPENESDVSRPDDVTAVAETRPKKGLLRKALHLKRSKRGRPQQEEEKVETANEEPTRGEPKEQEASPSPSCHVKEQARARDTPVKIVLDGVKIVVRPKDVESDVTEPLQDSAEPITTRHVDTATDQKLERLAAALERAQQPQRHNRIFPQSPATLSPRRTLPTSPKASPGARFSLSSYGGSPVGSAERLLEVSARMEERARVLGDRRELPRAARRLQMEWGVAGEGASASVPLGRVETNAEQTEGVASAIVNSAHEAASDGFVPAVDLLTCADPTGVETAELGSPIAGMLESESTHNRFVAPGSLEETVCAPESVAPIVEPLPELEEPVAENPEGVSVRTVLSYKILAEEAQSCPAESSQNPETPSAERPRPPAAQASGAGLGGEQPTSTQESDATKPLDSTDSVSKAAVSEAGGLMTSADSGAGVSLTSADPGVPDIPPAEPRAASPLGGFTGAAAFFRGASSMSAFPVARSAALIGQNRPVDVTGTEIVSSPLRLQVTEVTRAEAGDQPEPAWSPEPATVEPQSPGTQADGTANWSQTEGDHVPAEAPAQSPAGMSLARSPREENRGEESPEERPRGAAAFFSRANERVASSRGKAVVLVTGAPRFAAGATTLPVVQPASGKSADEESVPSVKQAPEAGAVSGIPAEQPRPTGALQSASEVSVEGTTATENPDSPPERMPNAAAFFGRRVARPVVLRAPMPLQELKGFANSPARTGVQSEKSGSDESIAKDEGQNERREPKQRPGEAIGGERTGNEALESTAGDLPTPLVVPLPLPTDSALVPAAGPVISKAQSVRAPSADVTDLSIPEQPAVGPRLAFESRHSVQGPESVTRTGSEAKGEAVASQPGSKPEVPEVESASAVILEEIENTKVGRVGLGNLRYGVDKGEESSEERPDGTWSVTGGAMSSRTEQGAQEAGAAVATALSDARADALMRENERLKAQVVLLQEEKYRIAKQMEANTLKANGNAAFGKAKYEDAKRFYNQALELRVNDNQFNGVIYTNRAAANLALGAAMDALADCAAALRTDPACAAAVLRKVDACLAIGDWDTALRDLSALEKNGAGTVTVDVQRKLHDLKAKIWRAPDHLDYYSILQLAPRSNMTAVKVAYKRLALRHHPDRAGPHADLVFQYIARAYQVLSNPVDKKKYDAFLQRALT